MNTNPLDTLSALKPDTDLGTHLTRAEQDALRDRIMHEPRTVSTPASVRRPRPGRMISVGAVGIAAAGVAILVTTPTSHHRHAEVSQQVEYRTVAQVVDAAAAAPGPGDPATAPYWEHALTWICSPKDRFAPTTGRCGTTSWTGNGRPSVYAVDSTRVFAAGTSQVDTYTVDGRDYTLPELNARTWTRTQIGSLLRSGYTSGPPIATLEFNNASQLLDAEPISRTIRQQIWAYLPQIPGVRLDGRATDTLGRPGWRISQLVPGWVDTYVIIDPATGRILETGSRSDSRTPYFITDTTYLGPAATAPAVNAKYESVLPPPTHH